jgi:hypothetical protein
LHFSLASPDRVTTTLLIVRGLRWMHVDIGGSDLRGMAHAWLECN